MFFVDKVGHSSENSRANAASEIYAWVGKTAKRGRIKAHLPNFKRTESLTISDLILFAVLSPFDVPQRLLPQSLGMCSGFGLFFFRRGSLRKISGRCVFRGRGAIHHVLAWARSPVLGARPGQHRNGMPENFPIPA